MLFKRETKSTKEFAYEALIKYNITSLPVPIKYSKDIRIYSMQFLANYHKENVSEYFNKFGYRGFTFYEPKYDNYVIFYNENDPEEMQRWVVSSAIALIEYHQLSDDYGTSLTYLPEYIDDFTYIYTCPDCVLKRDDISSAEQIIKVCKIPFNKAREKVKRLKLSNISDFRSIKKLESLICKLISKT